MSSPGLTWNVTGMTPTVQFVPGSAAPVEGVQVHWATNTGIAGSVFVPKAQLGDSARVRDAIVRDVQAHSAIHELNG